MLDKEASMVTRDLDERSASLRVAAEERKGGKERMMEKKERRGERGSEREEVRERK